MGVELRDMFQVTKRLRPRGRGRWKRRRGCALSRGLLTRRTEFLGSVADVVRFLFWLAAQEVVDDGDIGLGADDDVGVLLLQIGEEIEGEDYGAVGAVFERDHAVLSVSGLYGAEDVFDVDFGF